MSEVRDNPNELLGGFGLLGQKDEEDEPSTSVDSFTLGLGGRCSGGGADSGMFVTGKDGGRE